MGSRSAVSKTQGIGGSGAISPLLTPCAGGD